MKSKISMIFGILFWTFLVHAKTIRVTDMTTEDWNNFSKEEIVIAFLEGDRLSISIKAKGDFFETENDSNPIYVNVNKTFYIKAFSNDLFLSLNNEDFRPFKEMVGGNLSVGAQANGNDLIAGGLNVVLAAYLKQ